MILKEWQERVFHIPQSSRTEDLPSDGLVSFIRHLLGESYPSADMQSVYSTTSGDWAERHESTQKFT